MLLKNISLNLHCDCSVWNINQDENILHKQNVYIHGILEIDCIQINEARIPYVNHLLS